jgi:hypothetical protein
MNRIAADVDVVVGVPVGAWGTVALVGGLTVTIGLVFGVVGTVLTVLTLALGERVAALAAAEILAVSLHHDALPHRPTPRRESTWCRPTFRKDNAPTMEGASRLTHDHDCRSTDY